MINIGCGPFQWERYIFVIYSFNGYKEEDQNLRLSWKIGMGSRKNRMKFNGDRCEVLHFIRNNEL